MYTQSDLVNLARKLTQAHHARGETDKAYKTAKETVYRIRLEASMLKDKWRKEISTDQNAARGVTLTQVITISQELKFAVDKRRAAKMKSRICKKGGARFIEIV